MSTYIPTIGLEIHAELKTVSKMFCGCKNAPHEASPNSLICPVCMAHPGTLPVINKEAVRQVLRVGVAIGGTLADFSEFDRKNYFYPDIPKNYQISQYKYPLVSGGSIQNILITRIHLEEDTARSTHDAKGSSVDFNRAGVPLMELVTEPVLHDANTAVLFAKELRLLLQYLGAGEANLEKGEMRIEANVSVAKEGEEMGTKVEVKNLNSFKAVDQAITYEVKRHVDILEHGDAVVQETRGWDEDKQKTFSQRVKEESHDYRYYPDPDLPKLFLRDIPEFDEDVLRKDLPKLPWEIRDELKGKGIKDQTVELLVGNIELNVFYQKVAQIATSEKKRILAINYLTSDVLGHFSKTDYVGLSIEKMSPEEFVTLIRLVAENTVSSRGAKDVLEVWVREGGDPKEIADKLNILQISDDLALEGIVKDVIIENPNVVTDFKAGKESALQYLVGQGMKASKGAANPAKLQELLRKAIDA